MARPIRVRDKRTNEIIEFEWDDPSPPTRFDIDRIVEERRSKPFERPEPEPTPPTTFTPRFPTTNLGETLPNLDPPSREREPDFRTQVFGEHLLPEPLPPLEPPSVRSEAGKLWNFATTPLLGDVEEDIFKTIGKTPVIGEYAEPTSRFLLGGMSSPLGLATGGVIGGLAGKGINLLRKANKAKTALGPLDDVAATKLDDIAPITPISKAPNIVDDVPVSAAMKPAAKETMEATINPSAAVRNLGAKLPKDLAGATPRFNIGQTSYQPIFDNDLDKALYIIAQPKTSKRNADYMKFVMETTGMSEAEARAAAQEVKKQLHNVLKGQELGVNKVPRLYNPQPQLGAQSTLGKPLGDIDEGPLPLGPDETLSPRVLELKNKLKSVLGDIDEPPVNQAAGQAKQQVVRQEVQATGKTAAPITGDEAVPLTPQAKKAAVQKTPETGVPPSAQEEQSINDFVPKNINEALQMAEDAELKMKQAGKDQKFIDHFMTQFWNFPKSSWATLDLSAPLRQGKGLILRGEYWRSLDDMIKSGWSEQGYLETMAKIKSKELYPLMKKYDPGLIELEKGGKGLLKQEESRMSDWAENIPSLKSIFTAMKERDIKYARTYVFDPSGKGVGKEALGQAGLLSRGVRASNRAYSGFLNTLRADTMENMIRNYEKSGIDIYNDPKLLRATADIISTATGRSSLGNFEAAAETLNKYSFSVRFAKSRLDMGVLAPVKWRNAPAPVKKEVMKSLAGNALYWGTTSALLHAGGAEINLDPTSSDFGKAKIGNTRIDTLAGIQQPMVAVTRILSSLSTSPVTGRTTELGEGYRPETGVDVVANFTRNKLSPWAGLGWDAILKERTISGKLTKDELTRLDEHNYMVRMIAPNLISTLIDLAQEDPKYFMQFGIPMSRLFTEDGEPIPIPTILTKAGILGASTLGESIQVFDPPQQQQYTRPTRKKGVYATSPTGR